MLHATIIKQVKRSIKEQLHTITLIAVLMIACIPVAAQPLKYEKPEPYKVDEAYLEFAFLHSLASITEPDAIDAAIIRIDATWKPSHTSALLESAIYAASRRLSAEILFILERKHNVKIGGDINDWYQWLWNQPEDIIEGYADFKAGLYRVIDPRFEAYFNGRQNTARIRLDEIRWGGVQQDGIPPLRNPEMITASDASYLDDSNVVFGIEINGDARAYPKRILAWHEMFVDTVGGVDIAGVYCTLCGTVIPYKTEFNGVKHTLGTSGFLYRSNKLMYDKETQSLWNTIKGEPVLGPLAGKGIALEFLSVVTTTWSEWKRRHPETTVLSLNTGHRRNYGEGVAYNDYFSTDELMFNTPFNDTRLENKQEVLALRFFASPSDQLAIDTNFLDNTPIYTDQVGQQKLVVLTDASGANRVYDPKGVVFTDYDRQSMATDTNGRKWRLSESKLEADDGTILNRLPYHRAFWFGWHATYPETRLVK
ncbi:DUF3179 domain-containing protein [Kordiimonas aquimaris]|uniref:DUF3179 domain-containing protein n=1 Tax=Kordiimonas aquimaris TaxID=707591 RepID=UPI0021D21154|nr:DUF3179 domain-containing protein [Kordiimonas aquimaris]